MKIVLFKKTFEWRERNNIDNILDEDWSKWEKKFPYLLIVDKEDRPGMFLFLYL